MLEADINLKRARSPSNSELPKHKRTNTGVLANDSYCSTHSSSIYDDMKIERVDRNAAPASDTKGFPNAAWHSTSPGGTAPPIPAANIHMHCLISTKDASIIIGKGGSHVNEIREESGTRIKVSESIPGHPERILNVSGPLDAVSRAFGLIVRRINDEPLGERSVQSSRTVTIKFMIPNSRMGSVIGKGGVKIQEIQEASGALLSASERTLPSSTERLLSVSGVADAIHIATYHIGYILMEANKQPSPFLNHWTYRPTRTSQRWPYKGSSYGPGYTSAPATTHNTSRSAPFQLQTQQIYIPNDLVGCIIGKGGAKINEIRYMSASQIEITEPGTVGIGMNGAPARAGSKRLVVITGQPANIQIALELLHSRLEREKQKQLQQQAAHV